METTAIILSVLSICVAGLALGWNIYRDVVLKARVRVELSVGLMGSEIMETTRKIILSATNFGPGKIRLSIVRTKSTSILRRLRGSSFYGFVIHDYKNPFSGQLPTTLEVGEKVDLVFAFAKDAFLKADWTHVGFRDTFGREHWAPRKAVRKARADWKEEFGDSDA